MDRLARFSITLRVTAGSTTGYRIGLCLAFQVCARILHSLRDLREDTASREAFTLSNRRGVAATAAAGGARRFGKAASGNVYRGNVFFSPFFFLSSSVQFSPLMNDPRKDRGTAESPRRRRRRRRRRQMRLVSRDAPHKGASMFPL